jgi:chloramphenicol 3-O-phosphotransferase
MVGWSCNSLLVEKAPGLVVLFGGPAGVGKSTLAAGWCATRPGAAHLELDHIRDLIVSGRADPQESGAVQAEQYDLSVAACCALARCFSGAGYDVAIDDVLEPAAFATYWEPRLAGLDWRLVIVIPSLEVTLQRSARREKRVKEELTREQHRHSLAWPFAHRLDITGLTVAESLQLLKSRLSDG